VKRAVVTAAVPVFLGNGIAIAAARDNIIAALREAIRSGSFLQLAHGC